MTNFLKGTDLIPEAFSTILKGRSCWQVMQKHEVMLLYARILKLSCKRGVCLPVPFCLITLSIKGKQQITPHLRICFRSPLIPPTVWIVAPLQSNQRASEWVDLEWVMRPTSYTADRWPGRGVGRADAAETPNNWSMSTHAPKEARVELLRLFGCDSTQNHKWWGILKCQFNLIIHQLIFQCYLVWTDFV